MHISNYIYIFIILYKRLELDMSARSSLDARYLEPSDSDYLSDVSRSVFPGESRLLDQWDRSYLTGWCSGNFVLIGQLFKVQTMFGYDGEFPNGLTKLQHGAIGLHR